MKTLGGLWLSLTLIFSIVSGFMGQYSWWQTIAVIVTSLLALSAGGALRHGIRFKGVYLPVALLGSAILGTLSYFLLNVWTEPAGVLINGSIYISSNTWMFVGFLLALFGAGDDENGRPTY